MWQFLDNHPVLDFFLFALVTQCLYKVSCLPYRAWKMTIRGRNIQAHGWPPEHCDADGDFRPEPEAAD